MKIKVGFSIAAITTCLAATCTFATGPGFFVGSQFGQSNIHSDAVTFQTGGDPATIRVSPSNTGAGYRFVLGYDITQYGGIEFGITHYANSTYKVPIAVACNDPTVHLYGAEILGRGMIPVNSFTFIGKAGIAILRMSGSGSLVTSNVIQTPCGSTQGNQQTTNVRPALGVGVSYDMTQRWVIDLSWMRVLKGGSTTTADLKTIGFAYHFTDLYCGQFLC